MNTPGGLPTAENTTSTAIDVASLTVPEEIDLVEVGHLALGGPGSGTFAYQKGVICQPFLAAKNLILPTPWAFATARPPSMPSVI